MHDYIPKENLLKDRVILVTGAGDGIGRVAAKTFAQYGATVILMGRTISKLEKTYDEITEAGLPQPAIYPVNFEGATGKDYDDFASTVDKEFGRLDGILHNAAILGSITSIQSYDIENWYKVLQVNLNAPFLLTQACLGILNKSEDASIVFVSDCTGRKGKAYWGAYGVSKFGLEGFMQILADELEENTNIRVNSIDPGPVRTSMRAIAYPGENPQKLNTPEDVMVSFLYLMGADSKDANGLALSSSDFIHTNP
jgi:NAD(P)-dependent dehydrogenase (short-subunit alcohol dehydrogenase family)